MVLPVCLIAGIVVLDQVVKQWAYVSLRPLGSIPLIENVFSLTYAQNTGVAFSMFQGGRVFIIIVNFLILAAAVIISRKFTFTRKFGKIGLYLIIGGAIGNMIDRIARGFVIDLFDFSLINFAIFNVADCFVMVGCGLVILYVLFFHHKPKTSR